MKIFRLFALLALGLVGGLGISHAQTPDFDIPKDSALWGDSLHTQNPYGRENARISDNHWDPTTETWYTTVYDTVCDEYTDVDYFGFVRYTTDGTYTRHYFTDDFFDSIVTLHLKVKYKTVNVLPPTSGCDSYTWDINGQTYTTSQNIFYTLPGVHNVVGCDSALLLPLTINQNSSSTTTAEACVRYRWMGNLQWYRESGTYNFTRANAAGCDSNMTLNLTIWHGDTLSDVQNVCDSYTWGGNTYTNSTVVQHHFSTIHNCDSLVTLNLTIRRSTSQNFSASECDSYTWRGHSYTSSGTYRDTIPNAVLCDSVMSLNLNIRHSTSYTDNQTACDIFSWQVRNYDGSNPHTVGTYTSSTSTPTAVVTNKANCDSTIHLNLTVNHSNSSTQTVNVCDSYTWQVSNWDGSNQHTVGTYTSTPGVAPTAVVQNSHGCDSTITLNLTIRHRTNGTDVQNHCDSYTWINGSSYTSSTNTPTHTLTNAAGCDSTVRLNLTIRHSSSYTDVQNHCDSYTWVNGATYTASTSTPTHTLSNANSVGCDSNMRLNLTIRNSSHNSFTASECDSYTWTNHGTTQTFTSTGEYTNNYTNAANCPSTDTLHLTIRSSNTYTDIQSGCDSYTWINGATYSSSTNTPTHTITNLAGCDSVITLNLTINATSHVNDTHTACYNYTWHGHNYTTNNTTATWTGTNVAGCDSVVTLKLTIISYNTYTTDTNVCDAFMWNGNNYTANTNTQVTLTNQWGCDSIDVLHLVVRHSNDSTETKNVCDSYTWHGNTYTNSTNTPVYNTTNHEGCDSTVYLHLTVRHSTERTDVHDVCDRYTWVDGNTYTNSNNTATYHVPAGNAAGCDSTVHLNLTIRRSSNTMLSSLAQCDSYSWHTSDLHGANHTFNYTASGTYRDTLTNMQNCDSIVILPLTIHYSFHTNDNQEACDSYTWHTSDANGSNTHTYGPFTSNASQVANQHTIHGCDSAVTLHLTVYHSNLTGAESANVCDSIIWNGTKYTTSGTYTYNTTTTHHCDSMATLTLTVRKSTGSSHSENVCDSYTWHAVPRTSTGTYTFVNPLANSVGCDSTETLTLVVRRSTSSVTNQNVCDSFRWDATNVNYTSSGTYPALLTNVAGCDSNMTLNLTVRLSTEQTIIAHGCDHYTWHGVSYSNDTNVDFHTTNAVGCDSTAHLHLTMDATINVTDYVDSCNRCTWNGHVYYTNNTTATHSATSVAGCDSITTLHLTIHHPGNFPVTQVACDSFAWAGTTYYLNGTPIHTFTDQWGCDSTVIMTLVIHHSDDNTIINQTACDSYTWPTNGHTYTSSVTGEQEILRTSYDCDSIVTLNLTIRNSTSYTDVHDECDSYTWINGLTYTNSTNTPTHTIPNAVNCDSVITLNLTIRRSTSSTNTQNVCDSYLWDANSNTYTVSGVYPYQTTNAVGCDSNMTLQLTVRYRSDSTLNVSVCDNYTWHGNTYTLSTNAPTFDTINATGCDSTAHLHLTVRYSTTGTDVQNHCDEYPWHGVTYTASTNTPTYHTTNAVGCDSTATLNLTIRYSTTRTDVADECDHYTWVDGNTYTLSNNTAQFRVGDNTVGCDSIALLDLTVRHSTTFDTFVTACDNFTFRGTTHTSSTIYPETITNAVGCDSLITLHLTMDYTSVFNDVHDTCDTYTWTNGITYTSSTNTPVQHLYTVVGHCDSTSILQLTIRNSSTATDYQSHCDTYTWPKNNHTYTESNYSDTAHLVNHQLCDSLVTLNLTIRHTSTYTDVHDVCDSLVWHGFTYRNDNNSATYHTLNTDNCDSTVTLNLHVRYSTSGTDHQDICDSITWLDGILYTANNTTAQATISNMAGCDSLVTLNLNVRHNSNTPYTVTECDMYIWPRNTTAYDHTQTALYNYTSVENCPSTDTLHLTINNSSHLVFNQTACDNYRWTCHDVDTLIDASGTYFHEYTNAVNCASADTLHLTVNYNTSTGFHVDECDSYTWDNHGLVQTYTSSGTYYHDYNTNLGCPSTDTLYLNIRNSSHLVFDTTVCDLFHWDCHDHHQDYTLTGTYSHTYTNTVNCPSADTLHLTVNHNTNNATTLTVCDSYTWFNHGNTMVFTTSGDYTNDYLTAENCPSTDTLHLTVNYNSNTGFHVDACDSYTWDNHGNSQTFDVPSTYYNEYINGVGCPSKDTLYLTLRHSTQYTDVHDVCDSLRWMNDTLYTLTTHTPTYTISNAIGCDSVITLDLTVRHNSSTRYDTTACDSLRWVRDGILYPFSGTFTYNYTNAVNCPSTDTLVLTIHYNVDTAYTDTACDLYVWHENHNTAYNHSGTFYSQPYTVAGNVCNNIDTLYLTIYENTNTAFTQTACDTFVWNNHDSTLVYLVSGIYTNNYLTAENCPSTDTLHLTVNYNSDSNYVVSACDNYRWERDGVNYPFSVTRSYSYTNNVGCPSTDSLFLTIYNSTHTGYTDTACDLYVWTLNDLTAYRQSGTYYRHYMNIDSVCNNVDTLYLTVYYNTDTTFNELVCDTFHWVNHGLDSIYALTGSYTHNYLTAEGCPSIDTLNLSVNYNTNTAFTEDVCDHYQWINHGDTLNYDSTGTYLHDYFTSAGCPSTDTLYLTVRHNTNTRYDTTVCDVYNWVASADTTFSFRQSGTYIYDYINAVNCPSTDTLFLTVYYNTDSVYVVEACENYRWVEGDSVNYTFSGTFTHSYNTVEGCPSIDTLLLTIDRRTDSTWVDTACDYFVWARNHTAYNQTGVYTFGPYMVEHNVCYNYDTLKLTVYYADHNGTDTVEACDSILWHNNLYTITGLYNFDTLTVHGCDSTVWLTLTIHHNSNTLFTVNHACDNYTWERDSLQLHYDTTGLYTHSYLNEWSCPSTDTLRLTVYYKSDTTYIDTACDSYTWRPVHDPTQWAAPYTESVQDTHSYINYDGCPSLDTLILTLYPSPRGDETYTVCDSLLWRDGNIYRVSTDFPTDTAPSPVFCDSIITLHLTVNYSFDIDSTDYFCDSSSYIFHDSVIYTPGLYHYYGLTTDQCDSLIHLDLIQLPRPTLYIDEKHSCTTYEYTLKAHVTRSYNLDYTFYWYSEPEDLTLMGQEYDSTIVVHPVRNTQYFATVDYGILPTCNSTSATDTLVPIIQPHAVIKTTPPYVQAGDVSFRAEDKSFDYTSREWYLNGNYWGDERTFEYSAPASRDDSVALMLVSISPTCTDTAFLLVPIYNFNLYIPNIFTPTEPINQVFKVVGKSIDQFEIWIYTREGLLVYHSTDIHEGWNGYHKDKLCHQGAYVYHVRYNTVVAPDAWHTATGTVMLIR